MERETKQRFRLIVLGVQLTLVGIAALLTFGEVGLTFVVVGTFLTLGGIV